MVTESHVNESLQTATAKARSLAADILESYTLEEVLALELSEAKNVIARIHNASVASIPAELLDAQIFPRASVRPTFNGGDGASVLITITSLQNSAFPFRYSNRFPAGKTLESVVAFFETAYADLARTTFALQNVRAVNAVFAAATEAAGVGYTVSFVTPKESSSNTPVVSITNDEIVFGTVEEGLFSDLLGEALLFLPEGDDVTNGLRESAFNALVERIAGAQTVVEFLQLQESHTLLLSGFKATHIPTKIVKAFSKNALNNFHNNADGIHYYHEDKVFAGVRRAGGEYELLFGPVDLRTLEIVDLDVLSIIEDARTAKAA